MKLPIIAALWVCVLAPAAFAQNIKFERDRHSAMLKSIRDDIKKHYFDPQYKGIDLESHFKTADDKINQANSIGQMSGIIAQALVAFDDSHLFFVPPGKANTTTYGFEMQMIGDRCIVTRVREKSDAFKKGLQVGDELLAIQGYAPTRKTLWLMNYYYRALQPMAFLELALRKPNGKESKLSVEATIKQGKRVLDLVVSSIDINQLIREGEDAYIESRKQFIYEYDNKLAIWQMPAFNIQPSDVDSIMSKLKDKEALILDLRNNSGGSVDTCKRLVGHFFESDIKIGDEKTRKETKEVFAKSKGKSGFKGKLVVLVDSESGSASEVFARVVQLEKRGRVMGDVSAGAVMASRYFPRQLGFDTVIFYGTSVTVADLIMTDGKSLEKTGVTPDELLIPTPADIAGKRDVILSMAAKHLGVDMSPEQAGGLFAKEKASFKDAF